MWCKDVTERLAEYSDGLMEAGLRKELDQHLEDCPACRADLEAMRLVIDELGAAHRQTAPPGFLENLRSRMDATEMIPRKRSLWGPYSFKIPMQLATATAMGVLVFFMVKTQFFVGPQEMVFQRTQSTAPRIKAGDSAAEAPSPLPSTAKEFTPQQQPTVIPPEKEPVPTAGKALPPPEAMPEVTPAQQVQKPQPAAKKQKSVVAQAPPVEETDRDEQAEFSPARQLIVLAVFASPERTDADKRAVLPADEEQPGTAVGGAGSLQTAGKQEAVAFTAPAETPAVGSLGAGIERKEMAVEKAVSTESQENRQEPALQERSSEAAPEFLKTLVKKLNGRIISAEADGMTGDPPSVLIEMPGRNYPILVDHLKEAGYLRQPAPVVDPSTQDEPLMVRILLFETGQKK